MHGQHRGDRQQKWHMWPGPSQRSPLGTDADSACVKCFSKAGRKIGVGDCALFQAGNAPPFIGIIRKLIEEKESSLKLSVNWLYRPGDIKLGKGASLEAAPNEIFYSFHKDEISAASLLHPCKVAFLQKGVELPAGVSSFVCRRVYDTANRCLYWLTDQDYTDERQAEVDQLLDRTKHEMQPAAQSEGPSQRASNAPISSNKPEIVNAAPPGQGKGKKRERTDQNLDPSKRERLMKVEDSESKRECTMRFEDFAAIADKDGGLINVSYVDQLVQVMLQERNESVKKLADVVSHRTLLASIIAATEKEDCLTHFVQLGGLPVLDDWLQAAHKGKLGDGSPKEGDKGLEELLLTLLRALDKLPVDLDALKTCIVGKSVNNLRSHRNAEIQKKARKLVDTWKKRVDAEMKSSDEVKSGLNTATTWSSKPASETHSTKGRSAGSSKSSAAMKLAMNGSAPSGDTKCNLSSVSGYKEHPGITMSKDNSVKLHVSGASEVLAVVKEEKSCSSSQSQNNSQSWCSGSGKGVGSWKEEVKTLSVASQGNKSMGTTLRSHSHSTKSHPTASSTGFQKEPTGRHKTSGIEKMSSAALLDKVPGEGARAENSNSQRLIVRLPNPGRSPAHSISGGSLVDGGAANNRGSSPGSTDRHDSLNGGSRAPAVHSSDTSGDAKCGNCNANGGKSGADCKEEIDRSCIATADGVDCKSPDVEHKPKDPLTGKGSSDVHMGIVKKGTAASVTTATPVSSNMSPEGLGVDTVEGGIDLLASVAACEGSETEKSFSGSTGGEGHPPSADGNRDSAIHGRVLNETEFKNQGYKDGEKQKQDGLTKGSLEPVAVCVRESAPVQEYTELADASKEGSMISAVEKILGESVIDGATEMLSLDSFAGKEVNVPAARGSKADVIQDEYGGAKLITREATDDEKESMSRLSAGICIGSSLTGECQTAPTSSLDNVASLEEGSEDGRKNASSQNASSLNTLATVPLTCAKTGDSISGYYEEDALEVARQVAKEVEQEVEGYGKPEAQDANLISPCKNDSKSERPAPENLKVNQTLPGDTSVKDVGGERLTTDAVHADASVEIFTERREETDADRPPFAREKEVDQSSSHLNDEENVRPGLEPALDSVADTKEASKVEEHSHSPPATVPEESVTTTPPIAPSMEASVPDEGATLSKDRKSGSKDVERPDFDLNEGLVIDEVLHDHDPHCTVSASGLAVIAPDPASGLPAQPSSLAAPIAVVSATKGAFIPPSNLLRTKGELGWKGSAATSAFRPAEPRRMAETLQPPLDTTATTLATMDSTSQNGKQARFLDIDLNVADERVMEDSVMASSLALGSACQLPVGSVNEIFNVNNGPTASRPELDLNRVDESDESMGPLMSISRDADECNSRLPLTATRIMLDFDLNDGLGFEEAGVEEVSSQHKNLESSGIPVLAGRRPNLEFVNVAPWYSAASSVPAAMVIPAFSANRSESSYPVVAAPSAKSVITTGHNLGPFSGDPYPGGSAMSSSYTSTIPASFSYAAGLPFGAGFPFSSASYNVSSAPHVSSTNSLPFLAAAPSQLVSAGAVVSPYGRPYLMGSIGEAPGADSSASWARPSLDLNAGPDVASDSDARDEGFSTRPAAGFGQLSYQQAGGSSGGTLKRKEPEGGFDPYRPGFKQMTWR